jgi:Cu/Ag efflux protein CusF
LPAGPKTLAAQRRQGESMKEMAMTGPRLAMRRRQFVAVCCALVLAPCAMAQTTTAAGEILKLDKAAGRITIRHTGVKNLEMPAMTMVFRVRDPKLLEDLAVGDRLRFSAERIEGQYTVTALSKAP